MNFDHKEISRVAYKKDGSRWVEVFRETNAHQVNKDLMHDVINKKIHCCKYIKSIKYTPNYDGTSTYTVYYDNNTKSVYTVER